MATELTTSAAMRRVRDLPFCYLCGDQFEGSNENTRDHVPPKRLFAEDDRINPLILPAHRACNTARSQDDQAIGQLIGLLHGREPNPQHMRLDLRAHDGLDGETLVALHNFGLRSIVRRWVTGFHAALYR